VESLDLKKKDDWILFQRYSKCFEYDLKWLPIQNKEICNKLIDPKYWDDKELDVIGTPSSFLRYDQLFKDFEQYGDLYVGAL